MTAVFSLKQIVGSHDRIRMSFPDCIIKSRKIDLSQCVFVYLHIHPESLCLLVIDSKMLDAGCHIPGLHSLDKRNCQLFCQIWIFTEIFKIPSAKGTSLDIDPRSQNDILPSSSGLFTKYRSGLKRQIPIPCSSQRTVARQICHIIIGMPHWFPSCRMKFLTDSHRSVRHFQRRDTKTFDPFRLKQFCPVHHADLFIQCELRRQFLCFFPHCLFFFCSHLTPHTQIFLLSLL